jgi:cytochrome c oxidase assembly protein subunit 15
LAKQRLIALLALCACFFALGVISLGAFTRLVDAGLGCPDWPGCYGHLIVPTQYTTYKAWAEMIHRYFAGSLSLLILFIVSVALSNYKHNKSNIILALFLVVLVIYQILLGQWTVTLKLLPAIVSQHLLGGFLILMTLWVIYLTNRDDKVVVKGEVSGAIPGAILGLIILFLQISLGAWTSTNYASLSCPDFPFCLNSNPLQTLYLKQAFNLFSTVGINYQGGVLPEAIRQTIQMVHRFGALVVFLYMLAFTVYLFIKFSSYRSLLQSIFLLWGLLILQISLGVANAIFKLPLITAVCHTLGAVLLLLTMVTLIYKLIRMSAP